MSVVFNIYYVNIIQFESNFFEFILLISSAKDKFDEFGVGFSTVLGLHIT